MSGFGFASAYQVGFGRQGRDPGATAGAAGNGIVRLVTCAVSGPSVLPGRRRDQPGRVRRDPRYGVLRPPGEDPDDVRRTPPWRRSGRRTRVRWSWSSPSTVHTGRRSGRSWPGSRTRASSWWTPTAGSGRTTTPWHGASRWERAGDGAFSWSIPVGQPPQLRRVGRQQSHLLAQVAAARRRPLWVKRSRPDNGRRFAGAQVAQPGPPGRHKWCLGAVSPCWVGVVPAWRSGDNSLAQADEPRPEAQYVVRGVRRAEGGRRAARDTRSSDRRPGVVHRRMNF